MIQARLKADGSYVLRDDIHRPGQTYAARAKIKSLGGRWDSAKRRWVVPAEAVDRIPATRLYAVRAAAFCHTPEQFCVATQAEVDAGRMSNNFCTYCDSHSSSRAAILEVYGEGEVGLAAYKATLASSS